MTDHEERLEQLKEMQRVALEGKHELARPVVIGDIVDELNERVKRYVAFGIGTVEAAMEQAEKDFRKYIHAAIVPVTDRQKGDDFYYRYNA